MKCIDCTVVEHILYWKSLDIDNQDYFYIKEMTNSFLFISEENGNYAYLCSQNLLIGSLTILMKIMASNITHPL